MYRRRTNVVAWFLEELQFVITLAVAAGVRVAFAEQRLPPTSTAVEFAERAPRFDLELGEESDG